MPIEIITGDITKQDVDAIVNSANPSMLAGGGVCGAIHRAAGAELEKECEIIGHVDAGNAVITPGYKLKARYVIHAVAPQWFGGHNNEPALLEKCYHGIFGIVESEHFKSVAIPAMAVGTYRYPVELATPIAVKIAKYYDTALDDVLIRFVCFSEDITAAYNNLLKQ